MTNSTNFVTGTQVTKEWLNDVDALVFGIPEPTGASLVGYMPSGVGAVATDVQSKLRESVSVFDFIPLGTNTATTPCYTFIQAAHDAIVASGIPGVLNFGNGGYFLMGGPITVNAGFVSIAGNRAVLDFTTVGNIACVTVIGGNPAGINPYNQSDFSFHGFKLLGPGTGVGIYLNQLTGGSNLGPAHLVFRDLNIQSFSDGIRCGNHTYLNLFEHCDYIGCAVGFNAPTTDLAGNALIDYGANYSMVGGTFYNCEINIQQNQTTANLSCFGVIMGETSLGALGVNVVVGPNGSKVTMYGCHFESEGKAATVGASSALHLSGCTFIILTAAIDKYIDNLGFLSIDGGQAGGPGATTGTNLVYSGASGRSAINGLHFVGASPSKVNVGAGRYLHYDLDSSAYSSDLNYKVGTLETAGEARFGTSASGGSSANTHKTVGGVFTTHNQQAISFTTGMPTTLFTLADLGAAQTWLVVANCNGNATDLFHATAIVRANNSVASATSLVSSSLGTISASGLSVQYTQTSGGTQSGGMFFALRLS